MEADENIKSLVDLHTKQTQDLEGSFQHKMMIEVGRYQKLAAERENIHRYWETEHRQLIDKHNKTVADMKREFETKQAEDKRAIQRIVEEKRLAEEVHQETKELKEEKELRLKAEKDDKVRLRGMSGIHKRNHEDLKRQMQKKEEELQQYQEEARKKQDRIDMLEKEKAHNLKEIRERDKQIGDKEG